jgi:threonine dehydrogenase-like Zn-dependent dehydrogenase
MKGLWLENRILTIRDDLPVPSPLPGEALVRVFLAGICATDLELVKGYYPFSGIPGHEFVGLVEDSPSDQTWKNKRVVGEINIGCGLCPPCSRGQSSHCINRKVLGIKAKNGAMAEYLSLPLENLHRVPDEIPNDLCVFIEPLAAALEILNQVHLRPTDKVLLVGAGRLGQLIAQVFHLNPCNFWVVTRNPIKGQILQDRGIRTVSPDEVSRGAMDLVIDATGTPEGFELSRSAVRARGTIILKSTYAGLTELDLSSIVVDEVTIIGSRCGPFQSALELLKTMKVDPTPLISSRHPLDESLLAFEQARRSGELKVLIEIHSR